MLRISKTVSAVPAHVKMESYRWCKKEFLTMNKEFVRIRATVGDKGPHICHWCEHKFIDGEMMALAQPDHGKNKILCQNCAEELLSSKQDESISEPPAQGTDR